MPWTAVASEMRPYQSDLRENALLSDAILPAYRSSNGSRTSNSLPIKRFHQRRDLPVPGSRSSWAEESSWPRRKDGTSIHLTVKKSSVTTVATVRDSFDFKP